MHWRYQQPIPSVRDNGTGIFTIDLSAAQGINSSSLSDWAVSAVQQLAERVTTKSADCSTTA